MWSKVIAYNARTPAALHAPRLLIPISFNTPRTIYNGSTLAYSSFYNNVSHYSTTTSNNKDHQSQQKKASQKQKRIWPAVKRFSTFVASGTLVIGALGVSGIVLYLIGSELFSPNGDTQLFNRAVSTVQYDPKVRQLLQCQDSIVKRERLKAYGELITHDRWTRNRPITSKRRTDKDGNVHVFIRFHLESKRKIGLVHAESVEVDGKLVPKFNSVYIDVRGEKRHYIIKPKLISNQKPKSIFWWSNK